MGRMRTPLRSWIEAGISTTIAQSIIKDTTAPVARLESGQTIPVTETGPDGFVDLNISVLKADDAYPDRGNGQHFYSTRITDQENWCGCAYER